MTEKSKFHQTYNIIYYYVLMFILYANEVDVMLKY